MGVSGLEKDRHDHYFKKAKAERFRARSAFKLEEIQKKHKLLRPGMIVLDLGAAPGSWSQYAAKVVGSRGRVMAVDRNEIAPGLPPQVTTLQQDMLELTSEGLEQTLRVSRVDVVLSDMAPNTTGIRDTDHFRSLELCETALMVAERLLQARGAFLCKIFQGPEVQAFTQTLRRKFDSVKPVKPKASKGKSTEIFLLAMGYKGGRDSGSEA